MTDKETSPQNVKNALAYIPIVPFVLYFIEPKKTKDFERHIRYWMILFSTFFVLSLIMRNFFLWFLVLAYTIITIYLWYKAYLWEDVRIKFLDDMFEKYDWKDNKQKPTENENNEEL